MKEVKRFPSVASLAAFAAGLIALSPALADAASLTRDEAHAILKKSFKERQETGTVYFGPIRSEQWQIQPCREYTQHLQRSGLATVKTSQSTRQAGIAGTVQVIIFDVTPTDAMQRLLTDVKRMKLGASKATVVAWKSRLGAVTGISFNNAEKTSATVEYEVIYEGSPLSGVSGCEAHVAKPPASSSTMNAMFKLYDDGWRAAIR